MAFLAFSSPELNLLLKSKGDFLCSAIFEQDSEIKPLQDPPEILLIAKTQLEEYLGGERKTFDLPMKFHASEFQRNVLKRVSEIPAGDYLTYSQIAEELGGKNMVRAVARSIATNPLPIFIPCHRVLGKGKEIRGYLGGEKLKFWLLRHEGLNLPGFQADLFDEVGIFSGTGSKV